MYEIFLLLYTMFSTVQRSHVHVMAHMIFFCYSQVNNALSPLCTDVLSTNETHEKENFDDWYMIITVV